MLKKHSQFFESLLFLADLVIISLSWAGAYYIRFYVDIIPVYKGIPPFKYYLILLGPIVIIWGVAFKSFGLYRPKRLSTYFAEAYDIAKACTVSVLVLVSVTFFFRQFEFSRLVFLYFWAINIISLNIERVIFREILRFFRKKGYNLRYALIVGAGKLGQEVAEKIGLHPELGIKIVGFLGRSVEKVGSKINGIEVLGVYEDAQKIIKEEGVDQVYLALPIDAHERMDTVLKSISDEMVDIKVVPDLCQYMTLRGGIEEFEHLPIISLQDSPLYGWNIVLKRLSDILIASLVILITVPFMAIITVIIKLTSPDPVLYRQKRAGLDGEVFEMLKFRTMHIDAEKDTGPVWAKEYDPRRTKFGAFLRRTSLDELPQFFNVLKGNMSIVGPRPERPVFIEQFRKSIPRYMLRHKMKAGITGWAQVNGWRGNTDLKKRIDHDLYYIENWSLWFDLKIVWLTIWKGLIHRHAY